MRHVLLRDKNPYLDSEMRGSDHILSAPPPAATTEAASVCPCPCPCPSCSSDRGSPLESALESDLGSDLGSDLESDRGRTKGVSVRGVSGRDVGRPANCVTEFDREKCETELDREEGLESERG